MFYSKFYAILLKNLENATKSRLLYSYSFTEFLRY